jgi:ribosome-binding factor A
MPSLRLQRVAELLKREIGESIRREINVNDGGLISVNDVFIAGDLRQATAFVSVLGDAGQRRRAATLLEQARHRIQDHIAKAVVLRYTPVLKFEWDDSIERGDRVLKILHELEASDAANPGPA